MDNDNILIVEYLEWKTNSNKTVYTYPFDDDSEFGSYLVANLKFDTSWDWLMLVVHSLASNCMYHLSYGGEDCTPFDKLDRGLKGATVGNKELVYKSVVEFIKWYNKEKEKENKLGISK